MFFEASKDSLNGPTLCISRVRVCAHTHAHTTVQQNLLKPKENLLQRHSFQIKILEIFIGIQRKAMEKERKIQTHRNVFLGIFFYYLRFPHRKHRFFLTETYIFHLGNIRPATQKHKKQNKNNRLFL